MIVDTAGGLPIAYVGSESASAMYIGSEIVWSALTTQYTSLNYVSSSGNPCAIVTDIHPAMDFKARVGMRLDAESTYLSTSGSVFYNDGASAISMSLKSIDVGGVQTACIDWNAGSRDGAEEHIYATGNDVPWNDYCKFDYVKNGIYDHVAGQWIAQDSPVQAISNEAIVIDFSIVPIKFIKFWEGSRLIGDLGAVRRNSDGAVGLLDLVSGRFYEVVVTPAPTPTPSGSTIPTGYTLVDMDGVSSSDMTAGFNTEDFNPQLPDFHVRIKARLFGRSHYTKGPDAYKMLADYDDFNPLAIMFAKREQYGAVGQYRPYVLTHLGDGGSVKVGYQYNYDPFGKDIDWTLYPQGLYNNDTNEWIGTTTSASTLYDSEIIVLFRDIIWKELQVWQGNTLLFDGKAVIRDSDNGGGLYDVVSNTFYTDPNHPEYIQWFPR